MRTNLLPTLALEKNKMNALQLFAGRIAHDFNNILTAVVGETSLMLMDLSPDEENFQSAKNIEKMGAKAVVLTNKLRIFANKTTSGFSEVDLGDSLLETVSSRQFPPGISLKMPEKDSGFPVSSKPGHLREMIDALIENAVYETVNTGGTIQLKLSHELVEGEQRVVFEIIDQGKGFDESVLEHIFEPFFTAKPKGDGLGMGLSVVYAVATNANARICVSNPPEGGASVSISFPAITYPTSKALK